MRSRGKKKYIYIWYLVIKHGNGISPIKGSFDKKISSING
jgi:hypothetical protein